MVFPSLLFKVEPGVVSQLSAWTILAFSFVLHRFKKILLVGVLIVGGVFFAYSQSHAYAVVAPQVYPSMGSPMMPYANFYNYYGRPWGYAPSIYFYPQLSYPMMPMQQYYFSPHPMSPYNPNFNCPFCNGPQQQPNVQPIIHPNGAAS